MPLTRRDWLKGTAAVLAAGAAPLAGRAAGEDLRGRAKKNLAPTIFTGVYAGLPVDEAARRIKADGFTSVVLENRFQDVQFDAAAPDWDAAKKITDALGRQGLKIVCLFGYYNVVDPAPARRHKGEARMETLLQNWKRFECPVIATETGTFNKDSEWVEAPENYTERGYAQCRAAFARLARAAEKTGAVIAIEPYWRNIIDSPARTERLFRDVNSPALKLVMDPCNYYRKEDLPRMGEVLREVFRRVGSQTVIAHAKDVKASADGTDLPAAGRGVLDYPLYLSLLAGLDRAMPLAVEHLTLEDVARARDFVWGQMAKVAPVKAARTLETFQGRVARGLTPARAEALFGQPDRDVGSGLMIYEYGLADGSRVLLGFPGPAGILYAKHLRQDGTAVDLPLK